MKMLFGEEIEGLYEDGFEGSNEEHHIFRDVFYGNGTGNTSKRCIVTGVINFEGEDSKFKSTFLSSNSEKSIVTIHSSTKNLGVEDPCTVNEDSGHVKESSNGISRRIAESGCLQESCTSPVGAYCHDVNAKRMKCSFDELSDVRDVSSTNCSPDVGKDLNQFEPRKEVASGISTPHSYRAVKARTCQLVEFSSQGVISSCYLLKRHGDMDRRDDMGDVDASKCKVSSLLGEDGIEVVESKIITSPASQEGLASKLLVTGSSTAAKDKSRALMGAKENSQDSLFLNCDVFNMPWKSNSVKDLRLRLRCHVNHLFTATGWCLEKRKRSSRTSMDLVYRSPKGKVLRLFHKAWKSCGEILFADRYNLVQENYGKQWVNVSEFSSNLSNTLMNIEKVMHQMETSTTLAHRWNLLDPFVTVLYIDKKIGALREGKAVKTDENASLINLNKKRDIAFVVKNVDGFRNQVAESLVPACESGSTCVQLDNELNDTSLATESPELSTGGNKHAFKNNGSLPVLGEQRHIEAVKTLKGVPIYLNDQKCMYLEPNTINRIRTQPVGTLRHRMSGSSLSSVPACGSDITCIHSDTRLHDFLIALGDVDVVVGQAGNIIPQQDCNLSLPSLDGHSSGRRVGTEVKAVQGVLDGIGEGKDSALDRVVNQLQGFPRDQLAFPIPTCDSDSTSVQINTCIHSTSLLPECVETISKGITNYCKLKDGSESFSVVGKQSFEVEDRELNFNSGGLNGQLCKIGEEHKRNLKNLARNIGSEFDDERDFSTVQANLSADRLENSMISLSTVNFMKSNLTLSQPEGALANDSLAQHSATEQVEFTSFDLNAEIREMDKLKEVVTEQSPETLLPSRHNGELATGNQLCKQSSVEQQKLSFCPHDEVCHGMAEHHKEEGLSQEIIVETVEEVSMHPETLSFICQRSPSRKDLCFDVDDGMKDNLDFLPCQGEPEPYLSEMEMQSEGLQQLGHIKEEIVESIEASKSEMEHASVASEVGPLEKTPRKSKKTEIKLTELYKKHRQLSLSTPQKVNLQNDHKFRTRLQLRKGQICHKENAKNDGSGEKSLPVSSSQHQNVTTKIKKFQHQRNGSHELFVVTRDKKGRKKLNCENNSDEACFQVKNGSLDSKTCRKIGRPKKSKVKNENGQEKLRGGEIYDVDLLIAAIIKSKDFSSHTKQSAPKIKASNSKSVRKLKSQRGSCKLLPQSRGKGGKHYLDGKSSSSGQRTVLSWLINTGVVSVNDLVQYRSQMDDVVVKDGWVTGDGIRCKCCNKVLSVSEFKVHAGFKLYRPCVDLFMESGKPFTICQLQAWSAEYKARKGSTRATQVDEVDQNDDSCGFCGDGGVLICCDNCPSTFHQTCLPAQDLPEGSWYCPYCTCRICGDVVKEKEASSSSIMLKCLQCKHKYHVACIEENSMHKEDILSDTWFCRRNCQEVYEGLRSRVGVLNPIVDGFSWTLLRCIHGDQNLHSAQKFALMAECNSKLAVALTIMEECFLPMVDPRTGIDMIPHVLYNWGSDFARLNYEGFYTVVLEKHDEIISVASIRVHGIAVAEMPLIATCSEHRQQGMCRQLVNAIEEMLRSVKVERLVVAAIPNLVHTWTSGFGFKPMEDKEREQLNNINLMMFPGTTLLKKSLLEQDAADIKQPGVGDASSPLRTHGSIETGVCGEKGTIIESAQQFDEHCCTVEVGSEVAPVLPHPENLQSHEGQSNPQKHFSRPSSEAPVSLFGKEDLFSWKTDASATRPLGRWQIFNNFKRVLLSCLAATCNAIISSEFLKKTGCSPTTYDLLRSCLTGGRTLSEGKK